MNVMKEIADRLPTAGMDVNTAEGLALIDEVGRLTRKELRADPNSHVNILTGSLCLWLSHVSFLQLYGRNFEATLKQALLTEAQFKTLERDKATIDRLSATIFGETAATNKECGTGGFSERFWTAQLTNCVFASWLIGISVDQGLELTLTWVKRYALLRYQQQSTNKSVH
jgi:hypothetical protein